MSNAVSALQGASYSGFVEVQELGLQGMITLRGDLSDAGFAAAVTAVTGAAMPGVTSITSAGDMRVGWMSPDELLITCPYAQAEDVTKALSDKLASAHFLAANMSDARAMFAVRGAGCRNVIAKLAPVDMSTDAFAEGHLRRSRLAQAPAAFWLEDATTIRLICFRSVADYVFKLLSRAAMPGSEV